MFILGPAIVGLHILIKYVLHGSESDFGFAKRCMASGTLLGSFIIDQGTSSTKAFLFDSKGKVIHANKIKHALSKPKLFHVESESETIFDACIKLFHDMIAASGGGARGTFLQFIAGLLIIQVEHSAIKDCTVYSIYKLLNPDCDQTSFKSLLVNFV